MTWCHSGFPTDCTLLSKLLGQFFGLKTCFFLLNLNLFSSFSDLILIANEDLHENDVRAKNAYCQRDLVDRNVQKLLVNVDNVLNVKNSDDDGQAVICNVAYSNQCAHQHIHLYVLELGLVKTILFCQFLHFQCSSQHDKTRYHLNKHV